jgi:hypothetical protein
MDEKKARGSCVKPWSLLGENSSMVKWCALQVSNLPKTADSLGNYDSPSQIASQKSAESLSGLDSVVETWLTLSPALKSAVLSIIASTSSKGPQP